MEEIRIGSHVLQPNRQLLADGDHVHLGARALQILTVLAEAGGEIVTKDELFEAVWPGMVVEENALQAHIAAIRKALGDDAERLETMRGVGYRLKVGSSGTAAPSSTPASSTLAAAPVAAPFASIATPPRAALRRTLPVVGVMLLLSVLVWAGIRWLDRPVDDAEIALLVSPLEASDTANSRDAALARGITDELIDRLRQVDGLRIGTASPGDPVSTGPFQNAHTITGNVARNGERVRVTVRLEDPDGAVLWTDSYERELTGLFEVQELIAAAVGDALSVSLDVGGNSSRYGGTDNPEAFAAYLQWREHSLDLDQTVPQAFLERAIQLDPNYIVALAALAGNMGVAVVSSPDAEAAEPLLDRMDLLSRQAIDAHPELASAHVARGWYHVAKGDLVAADRSFARAGELDPGNSPEIEYQRSVFALVMGRVEQALAHQRTAELIDPIARYNPWQATALAYSGAPEQAHSHYLRLANDPDRLTQVRPHAWHVATGLLSLGREDQAIAFLEQHGLPGFTQIVTNFDSEQLAALSLAELQLQFAGSGQAQLASGPMVLAGYQQEPELALRLARIAFAKPGGNMLFVLWNPNLASARRTDEFERLVADHGLVQAWRESGNWGDFCRPVSETEIACE